MASTQIIVSIGLNVCTGYIVELEMLNGSWRVTGAEELIDRDWRPIEFASRADAEAAAGAVIPECYTWRVSQVQGEPAHQLQSTLGILDCLGTVLMHRTIAGEWEGVKERTLHAVVSLAGEPSEFPDVDAQPALAAACVVLGQQCIAVLAHSDLARASNGWKGNPWTLVHANGRVEIGGTQADFPVFGV